MPLLTMSGGRSRRKKLVRSKRLSKTDSEAEAEVNEENQQASDQQLPEQQQEEVEEEEEQLPPALEAVSEEASSAASSAAAVSTWRTAADMGDQPKWRRVAVRAVQLQVRYHTFANLGFF